VSSFSLVQFLAREIARSSTRRGPLESRSELTKLIRSGGYVAKHAPLFSLTPSGVAHNA
jgi:hypothetical protein